MGIVKITTDVPGQIGDEPRRVKIISTNNLAAVTAAGYLNSATLQGYNIYNNDIIDMWYGATISTGQTITSPGTYEVFTVSISNGVITLVQWANPGDVLLPVVSGDVAVFNGTSGQIKDSGVAFSNTTDTVASLFHGTATAGDFVTVNNANKTIQDSGAAPSAASQPFVVMSPGALTSGNFPTLSDVNGTLATGLPPSAASQAYVVVSPGSLTSGNLLSSSDTHGTVADSGIVATAVSSAITQLGTIHQVSVTLTPTNMASAYATPQTLIAAPGAGKVIQIISAAVYTASTGNTAYATGTAPIIQYGTTVHGGGTSAVGAGLVAGDITAATSQVRTLGAIASSALTGVSNTAVTFSNATSAYTAGTGTNVTFTLTYQVLTATV